ncbi:cytochrome P450 [Streptomyces sp. NPDC088788]|uniref:cytochrome P450 n=1 Tax=Streptomyces sp. NPDC088788 TaxID=3365898 RepID=UPI0038151C30
MSSPASTSKRSIEFAPRLASLISDYSGQDVFRLEPDTVGIAEPEIIDRILAARRALETERPTFKPLHGRSISRAEASSVTRTIANDVRHALRDAPPKETDLSGSWPLTGHLFLRDLILGTDPFRLRLLMSRYLELTPKLTWSVIAVGAALPGWPRASDNGITRLAARAAEATSYQDRRYAMGMYRRAAAPVCFTVSTLVSNALWLGAPFDDAMPNRNIILESLRLLPPSWNILRNASPEYPSIDSRIGAGDDVLVLPLLSHRDPALWEEPESFRPARWHDLDPDNVSGYLPFGHSSERCWGRHMVMPLAELLLQHVRRSRLMVDPEQKTGKVPLLGLLGVEDVRMVKPA